MMSRGAALEAILFAAGGPMAKKRLSALLSLTEAELATAAQELAESLQGHGLAVIVSADELELRTAPEAFELVKALREGELSRDLGKASLETLAVIAYRGSATRSEVDWVRGVNSTASVRTLLLRGLIEGKEDGNDRRRTRYALTTEALAHLGLRSIEELPRRSELAPQADALADAGREQPTA